MNHKKIPKILSILFFSINMAACVPKPETTVRDFVNAMTSTDFDKAKELCTTETKNYVDFFALLIGSQKDEVKNTPVTFKIDKTIASANSDTVIVMGSLYDETEEKLLKKVNLQVIKLDDEWFVNYNKLSY